MHPDARAVGFHAKNFKTLDTENKKGPPNCFIEALLLLKWITVINSNPLYCVEGLTKAVLFDFGGPFSVFCHNFLSGPLASGWFGKGRLMVGATSTKCAFGMSVTMSYLTERELRILFRKVSKTFWLP